MSPEKSNEPNQTFLSQNDRPELNLDPNQRLSELCVRDLVAILAEHPLKYRPRGEIIIDFSDGTLNVPGLQQVIKEVAELKEQVNKLSEQVSAFRQNPPN